MPDGLALTTVEDGTLTLIEPRTGSRREIITGVKNYSWGPLPASQQPGMILPADLYFLAPQAGITQVWLLPDNGSEPLPVTEAVEVPGRRDPSLIPVPGAWCLSSPVGDRWLGKVRSHSFRCGADRLFTTPFRDPRSESSPPIRPR